MPEFGHIIRAESRGGQLLFSAPAIAELNQLLRDIRGPVEVIIRKPSRSRSLNQNAYYHGVVIPMLAERFSGSSRNEIHESLKKEFLGGKSTTELSTTEFETYLEQIKARAAEMGVIIPDPEHVDYKKD